MKELNDLDDNLMQEVIEVAFSRIHLHIMDNGFIYKDRFEQILLDTIDSFMQQYKDEVEQLE